MPVCPRFLCLSLPISNVHQMPSHHHHHVILDFPSIPTPPSAQVLQPHANSTYIALQRLLSHTCHCSTYLTRHNIPARPQKSMLLPPIHTTLLTQDELDNFKHDLPKQFAAVASSPGSVRDAGKNGVTATRMREAPNRISAAVEHGLRVVLESIEFQSSPHSDNERSLKPEQEDFCCSGNPLMPVVYIFSAFPNSFEALSAFTQTSGTASYNEWRRRLENVSVLRATMEKARALNVRVLWVDWTPRRQETGVRRSVEAIQVFEAWLSSLKVRTARMGSLLLDRRIMPVENMVSALMSDTKEPKSTITPVDFVLATSPGTPQRYFRVVADDPLSNGGVCTYVLRGYLSDQLTGSLLDDLAAFEHDAYAIKPTICHNEQSRIWAGNFSGLMIELARRQLFLLADVICAKEGAKVLERYSVIISPCTPISAISRRVSTKCVYNLRHEAILPRNFAEWTAWRAQGLKELAVGSLGSSSSTKLFETFLPSVWPFKSEKHDTACNGFEPTITNVMERMASVAEDRQIPLLFENLEQVRSNDVHSTAEDLARCVGKVYQLKEKVDGQTTQNRDIVLQKLRKRLASAVCELKPQTPAKLSKLQYNVKKANAGPSQQLATTHPSAPADPVAYTHEKHSNSSAPNPRKKIYSLKPIKALSKRFRGWIPHLVAPKQLRELNPGRGRQGSGLIDSQNALECRALEKTAGPEKATKAVQKHISAAPGGPCVRNDQQCVVNKISRSEEYLRTETKKACGGPFSPNTRSRKLVISPLGKGELEPQLHAPPKRRNIKVAPDPENPTVMGPPQEHVKRDTSGASNAHKDLSVPAPGKHCDSEKEQRQRHEDEYEASCSYLEEGATYLNEKGSDVTPPSESRFDERSAMDEGEMIMQLQTADNSCTVKLAQLQERKTKYDQKLVQACLRCLSKLSKLLASAKWSHALKAVCVKQAKRLSHIRASLQAIQKPLNSDKDDVVLKPPSAPIWAAVMGAFYQTIWHLGGTRTSRKGKVRNDARRARACVKKAASILSSAHVAGQLAMTTHNLQSDPFRAACEGFFSSSLIHFARDGKADEGTSLVRMLFEEYEHEFPGERHAEANVGRPINDQKPASMRLRDSDLSYAKSRDVSQLASLSPGMVSTFSERNTPFTPSSINGSISGKRHRGRGTHSAILAHARNKKQALIPLARRQFAVHGSSTMKDIGRQTSVVKGHRDQGRKKRRRTEKIRRPMSEHGALARVILGGALKPSLDPASGNDGMNTPPRLKPIRGLGGFKDSSRPKKWSDSKKVSDQRHSDLQEMLAMAIPVINDKDAEKQLGFATRSDPSTKRCQEEVVMGLQPEAKCAGPSPQTPDSQGPLTRSQKKTNVEMRVMKLRSGTTKDTSPNALAPSLLRTWGRKSVSRKDSKQKGEPDKQDNDGNLSEESVLAPATPRPGTIRQKVSTSSVPPCLNSALGEQQKRDDTGSKGQEAGFVPETPPGPKPISNFKASPDGEPIKDVQRNESRRYATRTRVRKDLVKLFRAPESCDAEASRVS